MLEKPSAWAWGTGAAGHDPWSVGSVGAAGGWTAAAAEPGSRAEARALPLTRVPPPRGLGARLAFHVCCKTSGWSRGDKAQRMPALALVSELSPAADVIVTRLLF